MEHCGWIEPDRRTRSQLLVDREVFLSTPLFGDINSGVDLPDSALLFQLERQVLGSLLPRIYQQTGSCVGCSAARAYAQAMCGDVVHRNDQEEVKIPFPFATYGKGRQLGGMRGKGDGSFGSAQSKAVNQWGMLPFDHPKVPQPENQNGWLIWNKSIEYQWSWPASWPLPESQLSGEAGKYRMQTISICQSSNDVMQLLAQGYGVTMASTFGTNPKVIEGYLIGSWNGSWAHQMSIGGYTKHPSQGYIFLIDNQWGANAHPECPFLKSQGISGSFWITESTLRNVLSSRGAEVLGHSNTMGFPSRSLDWGNMGIGD